MKNDHFPRFFAKLLVESEENHDSPNLFSMHKRQPDPEPIPAQIQDQSHQDQSPISDGAPPKEVAPPSVQDQADTELFEEAVPLEDELASLLDDIDD